MSTQKNVVEWNEVAVGDTVTLHNKENKTIRRTVEFVVEDVKCDYGVSFFKAAEAYFPDTAWTIVKHEKHLPPEPSFGSVFTLRRVNSDLPPEVYQRLNGGWFRLGQKNLFIPATSVEMPWRMLAVFLGDKNYKVSVIEND